MGVLSDSIFVRRRRAPNVVPTNLSPSVNAGADQSITLPTAATLVATASDDGQIAPLTFQWSQTAGPGSTTFGSPTALTTTATVTVAGTYSYQNAAFDGALTATDTVLITFNSAPPPPPPGTWNSFDSGGAGGITGIEFHPADSSGLTLYATCDLSNIHKSVDGGVSWSIISGPLHNSAGSFLASNGTARVFACHPTNINIVINSYLPSGKRAIENLERGGLYRTNDAGVTWTRLTSTQAKAMKRGTVAYNGTALLCFVPASTTLHVSNTDGDTFLAARTAPITHSTPEQVSDPLALTSGNFPMGITVGPGGRVFYWDPLSTTKGAWFTDDNFATAGTRITNLDTRLVSEIACHPNGTRVVAITRTTATPQLQIWVSSNNGATFTQDSLTLACNDFGGTSFGTLAIRSNGTTIVNAQGMFNSTRPCARSTSNGDLGSYTTFVPTRTNGTMKWLLTSSGAQHLLRAGPSGRWVSCNLASVDISLDDGATYVRHAKGIEILPITGITVDSSNPEHVIISGTDAGCCRTTNASALSPTWVDVSGVQGDCNGAAMQDPTLLTRWYRLKFESGSIRFQQSTDNGATWVTRSTPPTPMQVGPNNVNPMNIIVDPLDANRIYSSSRSFELHRSTDRGLTFAPAPNSPVEMQDLVLWGREIIGFDSSYAGSGGGLHAFNIDTNVWRKNLRATSNNVIGFEVHPNQNDLWCMEQTGAYMLLAQTTKGRLMKSTNRGTSWTEVLKSGNSMSPWRLYINPDNTLVMLLSGYYEEPDGTFHPMMKSTDGGVTWNDFALTTHPAARNHFVYGGVNGRVYAAMTTTGVQRLEGL